MDVLDRADLPFPHSLPEFQRLFPDDAACAGETSEITSTSLRDNRANARLIATSAIESHVP